MSKTLIDVSPSTIPAERDCAEQHLHPAKYRIRLADNTMRPHCPRAKCFLVDVKLEVHSKRKLEGHRPQEDVREQSMRAGVE
jgi:hypothetical protein